MNRTSRRSRRGAAIVLMVLVLLVIVGFVGLALDWSYVYLTGTRLQTAADAAALAGAQNIWYSHAGARAAAIDIAGENVAGGDYVALSDNPTNDPDGDVVLGVFDGDGFTPTSDPYAANAVRVNARRTDEAAGGPLQLLFGPIFGKDTAEVARYATAVAEGGPVLDDIIALNADDPQSFYIYGHGYLDLGDGSAHVNSSDAAGATFQGTNITFYYGEVNMVGSWDERGNPDIDPAKMDESASYIEDPLADLPIPYYDVNQPAGQIITGTGSNPVTFSPGYYPGGLDLYEGHDVTLEPGIYILGDDFAINGHATLYAPNTMFYFVNGSVKDNGTGAVYLTPTTVEPYAAHYLQFWQAHGNTEEAQFNGTTLWTGIDDPSTLEDESVTQGAGMFYFPDATIHLNGTGDMYFHGLIADKIHVGGDGIKKVTGGYDGDDGLRRVYLVE